jgi:hypothetical protein
MEEGKEVVEKEEGVEEYGKRDKGVEGRKSWGLREGYGSR